MPLEVTFSGCSVFALITGEPDPFMLRLFMYNEGRFFGRLIITLITWVSNVHVLDTDVFFQVALKLSNIHALAAIMHDPQVLGTYMGL